MKRFYSNVSAAKVALEEAPEIFESVGVNFALNVLLGVVHEVMDVAPVQQIVSRSAVGIDLASELHIVQHFGLQSLTLDVRHDLGANFALLSVEHPHDYSFSMMAASCFVANAATFVHVDCLATNPSFVNFNRSASTADLGLRCEAVSYIPQSNADAMEHEPCRLLSDADGLCDLVAADTVFAVAEHPDHHQPLLKRDGRILKDGSHFGAELAILVGALTLPFPLIIEERHVVTATGRTGHSAIRPALRDHILQAVIKV